MVLMKSFSKNMESELLLDSLKSKTFQFSLQSFIIFKQIKSSSMLKGEFRESEVNKILRKALDFKHLRLKPKSSLNKFSSKRNANLPPKAVN